MGREQARLAKRLEKIQLKNATGHNKSIILNYSNVSVRRKTPDIRAISVIQTGSCWEHFIIRE